MLHITKEALGPTRGKVTETKDLHAPFKEGEKNTGIERSGKLACSPFDITVMRSPNILLKCIKRKPQKM